jgi:transposase-like protein
MERRKFTREFKLEAVKLIRERGVTAAQAARDLGGAWHSVAPMGTRVYQ